MRTTVTRAESSAATRSSATIPQYDSGIEIANAPDVRVLHNTVVETGGARNAFTSIDVRFSGSSGLVSNNLVERISVARWRARAAARQHRRLPARLVGATRARRRPPAPRCRGDRRRRVGESGAGRDLDGASRAAREARRRRRRARRLIIRPRSASRSSSSHTHADRAWPNSSAKLRLAYARCRRRGRTRSA